MALEQFQVVELQNRQTGPAQGQRFYREIGRPILYLAFFSFPFLIVYFGFVFLYHYLQFVNPFHSEENRPPGTIFTLAICVIIPLLAVFMSIHQTVINIKYRNELPNDDFRAKVGTTGCRILKIGFMAMGVVFLMLWIWFFTEGARYNIFHLKESK
jgi:tetrahydromethanopterin S-methyltransferase subunit F